MTSDKDLNQFIHWGRLFSPNGEEINISNPLPIQKIVTLESIDNATFDAFARQRFSSPFTLFDSKQIWDDPDIANSAENFPLFYDNQQVSGTGTTTTFDVNRASTTLAVSNLTAGKRVRQTKQRFNYQPGKSQLAIFTFSRCDAASGNTIENGLFDDNNGLFFRSASGVSSVVVRSSASGSPVDTVIEQSDWNLDTMDGNGASEVNLDPAKAQIPFIDFEWLGVGRVRFGWYIDGLPIYCHEVNNTNSLDVVYMSNPNLPIRASIENDGTGPADDFEQICSTVISEGGLQPNGIFRGPNPATVADTIIQANTVNTIYVVAGIRLKEAYTSANIDIVKTSLLMSTNDDFVWSLHLNPTLSSALTYTDIPNSAIQYGFGDTGATAITVTGIGTVLDGGLVSTDLEASTETASAAIRLGTLIDGTRDEIILCATPVTPNLDVRGMITWREAW